MHDPLLTITGGKVKYITSLTISQTVSINHNGKT